MWWKHCIFYHKTLWIATNRFVQSLSFWSPTQKIFLSWNIGSIIPLVFITYLALIHNYNTIKYICFISPQQHACMPSRGSKQLPWWARILAKCYFYVHCLLLIIAKNYEPWQLLEDDKNYQPNWGKVIIYIFLLEISFTLISLLTYVEREQLYKKCWCFIELIS